MVTKKTREKLSIANKGNIISQEQRNKISVTLKNKYENGFINNRIGEKMSAEAKIKISKAMKGKVYKIIKCPHCLKEGGKNIMKRWHFDNCSGKITIS